MKHEFALKAVSLVALSSQRTWGEEEIEVWVGLLERSHVPGDVLLATVEQLLTEVSPRELSPGVIITRCLRNPVIPPGHISKQIAYMPSPAPSLAEARLALRKHPEIRRLFNRLFSKMEERSKILKDSGKS